MKGQGWASVNEFIPSLLGCIFLSHFEGEQKGREIHPGLLERRLGQRGILKGSMLSLEREFGMDLSIPGVKMTFKLIAWSTEIKALTLPSQRVVLECSTRKPKTWAKIEYWSLFYFSNFHTKYSLIHLLCFIQIKRPRMCILNLKAYHSFFHHTNHTSNIFLLVSPISFHVICLRACTIIHLNWSTT